MEISKLPKSSPFYCTNYTERFGKNLFMFIRFNNVIKYVLIGNWSIKLRD